MYRFVMLGSAATFPTTHGQNDQTLFHVHWDSPLHLDKRKKVGHGGLDFLIAEEDWGYVTCM